MKKNGSMWRERIQVVIDHFDFHFRQKIVKITLMKGSEECGGNA
jgi:hypothetical protein